MWCLVVAELKLGYLLTPISHFGHANIIGYSRRPFFKDGITQKDVDDIIAEHAAKTGRTIGDRGRERVRVNWRNYVDVDRHDNTLIDNWNSVVGVKDQVYHLGDLSFGNTERYLRQLNGKITFIKGNHDKGVECFKHLFERYFEEAPTNRGMKIDGEKYILSHYPMMSWNAAFHGRIHFFGHVHTSPFKSFICQKNSYDVGVDNNNFTPISLEDAIDKAENNPLALSIQKYMFEKYENITHDSQGSPAYSDF